MAPNAEPVKSPSSPLLNVTATAWSTSSDAVRVIIGSPSVIPVKPEAVPLATMNSSVIALLACNAVSILSRNAIEPDRFNPKSTRALNPIDGIDNTIDDALSTERCGKVPAGVVNVKLLLVPPVRDVANLPLPMLVLSIVTSKPPLVSTVVISITAVNVSLST